MDIRFSKESKGILGISGHVGVGHVHSHSGFVQDDSAGLAVAARILKQALPVDTGIAHIQVSIEDGILTVMTNGGGAASAAPRRGIAPYEKELLESRAIGLDASFSQNAAVQVFGRLYGQGICETAAAFQGACALAVLDTFVKAAPERFHVSSPATRKGYLDRAISTVLDEDPEVKDYLFELFPDAEILEERKVRYHCGCSKERFMRNLLTLPKKDLEEIGKDEQIDIKCEFCDKTYHFDRNDIETVMQYVQYKREEDK